MKENPLAGYNPDIIQLLTPMERRQYASEIYHLIKSLAESMPHAINMTRGDPNQDRDKVKAFKPALKAARKILHAKSDHSYARGPGFSDEDAHMLLKFAHHSLNLNAFNNIECVIPTVGTSDALSLIIDSVIGVGKGGYMIAHTPNYGLSLETPSLTDTKLYTLPFEKDGEINIEKFAKAIRHFKEDIDKSSTPNANILYYLTSPHNPTGHVVRYEAIKEVARVLESYGCYAFHDAAYWGLEYDDKRSPMLAEHYPQKTFTALTCSKLFGLPDQRAGWVIGSKNEMEALASRVYRRLFSISGTQKAIISGAYAMDPDTVAKRESLIKERVKYYRMQTLCLMAAINGIDSLKDDDLGSNPEKTRSEVINKVRGEVGAKQMQDVLKGFTGEFSVPYMPQSGFFLMVDVSGIIKGEHTYEGYSVKCAEHVAYMLCKEAGLVFLPGGSMLADEPVLRLSASTPLKKGLEGIQRMQSFVRSLEAGQFHSRD